VICVTKFVQVVDCKINPNISYELSRCQPYQAELAQTDADFSLNDLPEHGVRQRRNVDQRSKYNQSLGRSIEQRPMMINQRKRIGDFELDTVVGPRGHSKAVLLTLIKWI
jgi:IS30 family transposase